MTDKANQVTQVGDRQRKDNECLLCCVASTCVNNPDVCAGIAVTHCWTGCLLTSASQNTTASTAAHHDLSGLSMASDDDLMLMACDLPQPQLPVPTNTPFQPQLLPAPHAGGHNESWGFGDPQSSLTQLSATGKQAGYLLFILST